jgi:precorrin-8X/cobalt-precorrin-8 methylmutase
MEKEKKKIKLQKISPLQIEAESFRIIESEMDTVNFSEQEFSVVRRCIHATGDFSFADNIRFHPQAITAGLSAIRAGKNILIDVNMGAAGISRGLLNKFGGRVICLVAEDETASMAKEMNITRSEAAMERAKTKNMNIGIVAIGNAPTALLKSMEMMDKGSFAPELVIGVPVGFVNAAESKDILVDKPYPFITALGRKGGTPVAVATVNALLRLA